MTNTRCTQSKENDITSKAKVKYLLYIALSFFEINIRNIENDL